MITLGAITLNKGEVEDTELSLVIAKEVVYRYLLYDTFMVFVSKLLQLLNQVYLL